LKLKLIIICSLFIIAPISLLSLRITNENPDYDKLITNEKNTIDIFKNSVDSVVNVSNIRLARRSIWDFESVKIPAGAGTGFIWDDKGHIVTNYHVVKGGESFLISFHNDKKTIRGSNSWR